MQKDEDTAQAPGFWFGRDEPHPPEKKFRNHNRWEHTGPLKRGVLLL